MSQQKFDTGLALVNFSQLTFSLWLELGINNMLQKYLDARKVYINDSSFLIQCVNCTR